MSNFYDFEELESLGFRSLGGRDILISKKASIFRPERISIGNHVRIDDFCLLSGDITFGSYIHVAAYAAIFGGSTKVVMDDFSGMAYRSTIVAETDDYSGDFLTNPMIDAKFRHITCAPVHLGKHALLGTGAVVLPGVDLKEGCSVGSMALVTKSTDPWGIYVGVPAKRIKERSQKMLEMECSFLSLNM